MQRNEIRFTEDENQVLQNKEFLPLKQQAVEKIITLMSVLREQLDEVWTNEGNHWPVPCKKDDVKISRGENYRQLPYVILDYPRKFARDDVFAFRSMFWWGHFFSYTLHLQGNSLETYRSTLAEKLSANQHHLQDAYLCVGDTPWQYHYESDNYQLIRHLEQKEIRKIVRKHDFFKISAWLPVSATPEAVFEEGKNRFSQFMRLLYKDI